MTWNEIAVFIAVLFNIIAGFLNWGAKKNWENLSKKKISFFLDMGAWTFFGTIRKEMPIEVEKKWSQFFEEKAKKHRENGLAFMTKWNDFGKEK